MYNKTLVKGLPFGISAVCLLLIIIHAIYPEWRVDAVTLGFVIVGVLPWLHPIVKSIKFPGGWGLELQDYKQELKTTVEAAKEVGLIKEVAATGDTLSAIGTVFNQKDHRKFSLLKLRHDIESKLKAIISAFDSGEGFHDSSLNEVIAALTRSHILDAKQSVILTKLVELLDQAIHGSELDYPAYEWAMGIGPQLLKSFDDL